MAWGCVCWLLLLLACLSRQSEDTGWSLRAAEMMQDSVLEGKEVGSSHDAWEPGYHQVQNEEKTGYVSFYLNYYLIGEKHAAIHRTDREYGMIALNTNELPLDIEAVVVKDLDGDSDNVALVKLNRPLEDKGSYKRAETRAVYEVTKLPLDSVIRDVSVYAPFDTSDLFANNKDEIMDTQVLTAIRDENIPNEQNEIPEPIVIEADNWIPECTRDGDELGFTSNCTLNWPEGKKNPNPILEECPNLYAGLRGNITGKLIIDKISMEDGEEIIDSGYLNLALFADIDARIGFKFNEELAEEEFVVYEIPPKMSELSGFTVKILFIKICINIGVGTDMIVDFDNNIMANGDVFYDIKINTPHSMNIIYPHAEQPLQFGPVFVSEPEVKIYSTKLNKDYDNEKSLESYIHFGVRPYIRIEFVLSSGKEEKKIVVDVDLIIQSMNDFWYNKEVFSDSPYISFYNSEIDIVSRYLLTIPEIDIWNDVLFEEETTESAYTFFEYRYSNGILLHDSSDISIPSENATKEYMNAILHLNELSFSENQDFLKLEITSINSTCGFYIHDISNKASYCTLEGVQDNENINITLYYSTLKDSFGTLKKYNGTYKLKRANAGKMLTLSKGSGQINNDNSWGNVSKFNVELVIYKTINLSELSVFDPESNEYDGAPLKVNHEKSTKFYHSLTLPQSTNGSFSLLFHMKNENKEGVWTTGDEFLTYYSKNYLNKGEKRHYKYSPSEYETRKFTITSIDNKNTETDFNILLCLLKAGDKSQYIQQCNKLQGGNIIDISGDLDETYPIKANKEINNVNYSFVYQCCKNCDDKSVVIRTKDSNGNYETQIMIENLCHIEPIKEQQYSTSNLTINYTITTTDNSISVVYDLESNYNLYKQYEIESMALSEVVDILGVCSKDNDSCEYVLEYSESTPDNIITNYCTLLIHLDLDRIIESFNVVLEVEVDSEMPVIWFSDNILFYDKVYLVEGRVSITCNENESNCEAKTTLPFKLNSNSDSLTFKLLNIYSIYPGRMQCEKNKEPVTVEYDNSKYPIICVLNRPNEFLFDDLIYRYYDDSEEEYKNLVVPPDSEINESFYNIKLIPPPLEDKNEIEITYAFTRFLYIFDPVYPVATLPEWIAENVRNLLFAIVLPYNNGAYTRIELSGNNYKKEISDEFYIDSTVDSRFISAIENSTAFAKWYCKDISEVEESSHEYLRGCLFKMSTYGEGTKLVEFESSPGIRVYDPETNTVNSGQLAYSILQYIDIKENELYVTDFIPEARIKFVLRSIDTDTLRLSFDSKKEEVPSITYISAYVKNSELEILSTREDVNDSSEIKVPITRHIYEDEKLMQALLIPGSDISKTYLTSSGTLQVYSNVLREDLDLTELSDIAYPLTIKNVKVNSKCEDGKYDSKSEVGNNGESQCVECDPGHFCSMDKMNLCRDGFYQIQKGQNTCVSCGEHASSNRDYYTRCIVDDGYYISKGSYGIKNDVVLRICPKGYYCKQGERYICNSDEHEYSDAEEQSQCKKCLEGAVITKNDLSIGCGECPDKTVSNGEGECIPEDGYYYDNSVIKECEAGYYCTGGVKAACSDPSSYSEKGKAKCSTCPTNSHTTDHIKCISDSGYYVEGQEVILCPAGYSCKGGVKTICTKGTYQSRLGSESCIECPMGTEPANELGIAIKYGGVQCIRRKTIGDDPNYQNNLYYSLFSDSEASENSLLSKIGTKKLLNILIYTTIGVIVFVIIIYTIGFCVSAKRGKENLLKYKNNNKRKAKWLTKETKGGNHVEEHNTQQRHQQHQQHTQYHNQQSRPRQQHANSIQHKSEISQSLHSKAISQPSETHISKLPHASSAIESSILSSNNSHVEPMQLYESSGYGTPNNSNYHSLRYESIRLYEPSRMSQAEQLEIIETSPYN